MKRASTWVVVAGAAAIFACAGPAVNAGDVVVTFSGTFGEFNYGNQPAPLNDGSFSGSVTLPSLPGPNSQVISATADVNFYNSTGQLVFSVGGSGSYDTMSANGTGYTELTVSGNGHVPGSIVDVAPFSLEFSNWSFGSQTGTVKPYGPPNYASAIEYTYNACGKTYFNPVLTGMASVPEPSAFALCAIGMGGILIYARRRRRRQQCLAKVPGVSNPLAVAGFSSKGPIGRFASGPPMP